MFGTRTEYRPVTVPEGASEFVDVQTDQILDGVGRVLAGQWKPAHLPEYWDGQTAGRIAVVLT